MSRRTVWGSMVVCVPVTLALMMISGCADRGLVEANPASSPYDGPLRIEQTTKETEDHPDRGGAAGLALNCETEPTGDNRFTAKHQDEVFRSPERALRDKLEMGIFGGTTSGYRVAAEQPDRVLYTYLVDGVAKQAFIAHDGESISGKTGWYVESWARCDPAEFPETVTDAAGLQIWTDESGRRVPTTQIISSQGPEHCGMEAMTFLTLDGKGPEEEAYVANADPEMRDYFAESYRRNVPMPEDAVDTGFHRGDRHLWLSSDGMRAYVGADDVVDVWPRTTQMLACG